MVVAKKIFAPILSITNQKKKPKASEKYSERVHHDEPYPKKVAETIVLAN